MKKQMRKINILDVNINNLLEMQFKELKEQALFILRKAEQLIQNDKYIEFNGITKSITGQDFLIDEDERENIYEDMKYTMLNFDWNDGFKDIGEIIERLSKLKTAINKNKEN